MADRQVREGAEGYTQFDNPQSPYNKPFGLVGRFFKKFFSREVEDFEDGQNINPITKKQVAPSKPLQGDAVQNNQIVKIPAEFGYAKSSYPILPQIEGDRKKRYKEDNAPRFGTTNEDFKKGTKGLIDSPGSSPSNSRPNSRH